MMEWTTEKPTQEGLYWACSIGDYRLGWKPPVEMVEICQGDGEGESGLIVKRMDYAWRRLDYFSHWIGPLPKPVPPSI